jgi:hypothetical protein
MSLNELESELSAALPIRTLMSRRHGRRMSSASAHANNGSVANGNSTSQSISNPQSVVATGVNNAGNGGNGGIGAQIPLGGGLQINAALALQVGANNNSNSNTQYGVPVNEAV